MEGGLDHFGLRPLRDGIRSLRARRNIFRPRGDPDRFDAQAEQRHASETGRLPKAVTDELALMDRADLLVLQYPMWWHLPPAMMKGWFDRVLAYGDGLYEQEAFENGRFVGKRAMLSVTVGTSRARPTRFDGRSGDIDLMLWPVNFSLAYVGYEVLTPFVAYGVEAGPALFRPGGGRGAAARDRRGLPRRIAARGERATLAFNRMAEWGADGRIAPARRSIPPSSAENKLSNSNERDAC